MVGGGGVVGAERQNKGEGEGGGRKGKGRRQAYVHSKKSKRERHNAAHSGCRYDQHGHCKLSGYVEFLSCCLIISLKEQLKSNHLVSVQACIRIEMPSIQACNQYQMYTRSLHTTHHHPPNIVKRRCCKQQMRVSPMKYLRHIKNAIPASLGTCFGLRCGLTGCGAGAVQGRPLS